MPNPPHYFPKLPETATVAYYDAETDQNLTVEEWKQLNPAVNPSEVKIINQGETYISWKAGVDYPIYGPGFWDDFGSPITKALVSTAGAVVIIGTGGAAAPIVLGGAALGFGGKAVKELGKEIDCEVLEWIGDTACDTGIGVVTGSVAGWGSSSLASHIGNSGKAGGALVGGTMKISKEGYDRYGNTKTAAECAGRRKHRKHRKHQEEGINYVSYCSVCVGTWPFN